MINIKLTVNKTKFLLFIFLLFVMGLVSCGSADNANNKNNNGLLKLIITNKTDYEVTEIYYKQTDYFDSENGYGVKLLNGEVLSDRKELILCPDFVNSHNSLPYYFTFARQKGSTDNKFFITTDMPIYLSSQSGIVNIDLLPYSFYLKTKINSENTCNDGQQNGE